MEGGGGATSGEGEEEETNHHHHHHLTGDGGFDRIPLLRREHLLPRQHGASQTGGGMGPFLTMRETAALQLEERHTDWGYSSPIVALDIVWNLVFVVVAGSVLLSTAKERPPTPIRAWIAGYVMQCLLHAGFVWLEYRRRRRRRRRGMEVGRGLGERWGVDGRSDEEEEEEGEQEQEQSAEWRQSRIMKKLESTNAVISFVWWIVGFYWIVIGGQTLLQDAPRLYWLTVVFLAFDVFFAIFCILLACFIGIALCCCLPCIIAILFAVAGQEGASDSDLSMLPRFRFREASQSGSFGVGTKQVVSRVAMELDSHNINDLALSLEDSECCICLSKYEDGVELHSLPCNHHFHTGCIVKWLRINATCPLCKYNILKGDEQV